MLECVQLCVLVTFFFATKKHPPNKSDLKRKEFILDGSFRELQSIMAETTWHQKKDSSWSYYLQLGKQIEQKMLQKGYKQEKGYKISRLTPEIHFL